MKRLLNLKATSDSQKMTRPSFQKTSEFFDLNQRNLWRAEYFSSVKMKIIYFSSPLIAMLLAVSGCGPGKQATSASGKREAAAPAKVTRVSFSDLAVAPKPDVTPQLLER